VWIKSTTLWTGHGAVYRGPVAAVVHDLASVRPRRRCDSSRHAVRSSGVRGRCEEPILGISGERATLGRGGRRLREKQRCRGVGGFRRNNDVEGSQEQGQGGEAGLWRCGAGSLFIGARNGELGAPSVVVVASETTSLMARN
jgi:hypothetical protein